MIQRISELVAEPARDFIYELLRYAPPDLCIDIGAAAGAVTLKLYELNPGKCRVVAYEPFPGNFEHFETTVGTLPNVSLVRKAVSDSIGVAQFYVPSSIQGSEAGWEKQVGYSSVGFLVNSSPGPVAQLKRYASLAKRMAKGALGAGNPSSMLRVDTATIDTDFPDERIGFMKIDVQGAEAKVLRGASSKLGQHKVDLLYIEWSGDKAVLELLERNGYRIYDSTYIVGSKEPDRTPFERMGFRFISEVPLSTGATAFEFYLPSPGPSPEEAIELVQRNKLGWIQTDLIAVSPESAATFSKSLAHYLRDSSRNPPHQEL